MALSMSVNVSKCSGRDRRVNELGDYEQVCGCKESSRHIHRIFKKAVQQGRNERRGEASYASVERNRSLLAFLRPALQPI
jgi:hypothetical protein